MLHQAEQQCPAFLLPEKFPRTYILRENFNFKIKYV